MDDSTQRNAAITEQAAAAASSLLEQAVHLSMAIKVLKLVDGPARSAAMPRSVSASVKRASRADSLKVAGRRASAEAR